MRGVKGEEMKSKTGNMRTELQNKTGNNTTKTSLHDSLPARQKVTVFTCRTEAVRTNIKFISSCTYGTILWCGWIRLVLWVNICSRTVDESPRVTVELSDVCFYSINLIHQMVCWTSPSRETSQDTVWKGAEPFHQILDSWLDEPSVCHRRRQWAPKSASGGSSEDADVSDFNIFDRESF